MAKARRCAGCGRMYEMTTVNEEWRPVVGYEGLYEVSDMGNVRSLDRIIRQAARSGKVYEKAIRGHMLRPGRMPGGHMSVSLGRKNSRCVHDLVLTAFEGPRPEGQEARHLDGAPANNRRGNLAWSSRGDNGRDKKWHNLPAPYKLRPPEIASIKAALARGQVQAAIARDFNVSPSTIHLIKKGRVHGDVACGM